MDILARLRSRVQEKRELHGLAPQIVDECIHDWLRKHQVRAGALGPREQRLLMKEVRARLRASTGRFQKPHALRPSLLAHGRFSDLLATHASTAARHADYPLLRKEIEARGIRSILDLGSGLNPLALARPGMRYCAVDMREDELAIVASYFKHEGIDGQTQVCDLRTELPLHPPVDLCLLMNVLDVLEARGHKRAETILTNIQARYFFITFSTKTLSGKPMRHPQRGWIERLLTRRGFTWKRIPLSTEVLYVAAVPGVPTALAA